LADFKRGIKAGISTGGIYIVISAILGAIGYKSGYLWQFIEAAGLGTVFGLTVSSFIHELLFQYVVRGVIFGAVFAVLYDYLPGVTSVVKGVVLSAFLCIVALVGAIYITPGWPTNGWISDGFYYTGTLNLSSLNLALAAIISALAFGALTGFLWNKFRGREFTDERKGKSVLLISFILGGVTWILLAETFIIEVVIGGAPAIGPNFWWTDLLFTSVVFLGLPGWVLTLVAWRRTKKGKSGFKWGVAGGIMMALTGIILFPGVLAIIGGVVSRRKPTIESSNAEIVQ
jgi:hypothetical protein